MIFILSSFFCCVFFYDYSRYIRWFCSLVLIFFPPDDEDDPVAFSPTFRELRSRENSVTGSGFHHSFLYHVFLSYHMLASYALLSSSLFSDDPLPSPQKSSFIYTEEPWYTYHYITSHLFFIIFMTYSSSRDTSVTEFPSFPFFLHP